jgi:hypothetical protein
MKTLACMSAATFAMTLMMATPLSAQPPSCPQEGECSLVPPNQAQAQSLILREVRDDDVCYDESTSSWVSPSELTEGTGTRTAGPGDICYDEGVQSWIIPR